MLQLSVAVAPPLVVNHILNEEWQLDEQLTVLLQAGVVMTGAVLSATFMLAEVVDVFPQASLAVNVTDTEPLQPVGSLPL